MLKLQVCVLVYCALHLTACQSTPSEAAHSRLVAAPMLHEELTEHVRRKASPAGPHTVHDLAWLAGRWVGEGFGGQCEETWNPALRGEMVGTFRLIDENGQPAFYELMTLKPLEDSVVLRLVHFSSDLKPWEEPGETTDFHLIDCAGTTAWFGGLTLHREGNRLIIYLAMSNGDAGVSEVSIDLVRAAMGDA